MVVTCVTALHFSIKRAKIIYCVIHVNPTPINMGVSMTPMESILTGFDCISYPVIDTNLDCFQFKQLVMVLSGCCIVVGVLIS